MSYNPATTVEAEKKLAEEALHDPNSSSREKSLAGSVLRQSNKERSSER